jgi:hypothetical protein
LPASVRRRLRAAPTAHRRSARRTRTPASLTVQHVATPHNTLQHRTARCITVQHVATQHDACRAARPDITARRTRGTGPGGLAFRSDVCVRACVRACVQGPAGPLPRRHR